jgi:hypothetical protein
MRMSARLRSQMRAAVMPFLRPSSWPLRKASPTSDANAPVTTMMLMGPCVFISFCVLARNTARAKI